jgi:CSLREA domain-containing protein
MPFILSVLVLLIGNASWGATFTVNSTVDAADATPGDGICATATSVCSLRAAVQEANALVGADAIILPAGIYTLTIAGAGEDAAATGDLDIIETLTISGARPATTIIDGNAADRVFQTLTTGTVTTISGVTIRNGNSGADSGGGISVSNGTSLTLNNALVTNCVTGLAGEGGGIESSGTLTMNDVAITNNTSPGGGINNGVAGTMTLTNGTLSGNSDRAINNSGALTLTNVSISGNTTTGDGGGLDNGGTATLQNVTISDNTAPAPANIGGIRSDGTTNIRNSIISNNAPVNCGGAGTLTSQGNNLSSDTTCILAGAGDVTNTDPLLGPLATNFSRLQTHALLVGSPAIDTGDPLSCPATDERSIPRPLDGDGNATAICDKGAFEVCSPALGDVLPGAFGEGFIKSLFCRGITAGCTQTPLNFCPDAPITRGQMAVFIEVSLGRPANTCQGRFADVPVGNPFCGFIERLADDGITSGCAAGPPAQFCPDAPVTRGQMAVFIEAALGNPANTCATRFTDVPAGNPFCGFVERLADDGITGGCVAGPPAQFCPDLPVTRAQMSVFLTTGFFQ